MQQFKTLLQKEFWTHKTATIVPGYIISGIYVCLLIALIIAFIKNPDMAHGVYIYNDMSLSELSEAKIKDTRIDAWILGFVIPFFVMFVVIWPILGITNGALNDDHKHKCALFHKSLPVSFIKQIAAKLVYVLALSIVYCLAFSIVSLVINSILLAKYFNFGALIGYGFIGGIQGSIYCWLQGFMLVSLAWFFSAIFKGKTFIKTITTVAALSLGLFIIGKIFGITNFITGFYLKILDIFFIMNTIYLDSESAIVDVWVSIFSADTLFSLVVGTVLLTAGYFILSKREIE